MFTKGERVGVINLKKLPQYNGFRGIVLKFMPETFEFQVRLDNGNVLSMKACNLKYLFAVSKACMKFMKQLEYAVETKDVELLLQVFEDIKMLPHGEESKHLLLQCFAALEATTHDVSLLKMIAKYGESRLEDQPQSRLEVQFRLALSRLMLGLEERKKAMKLLLSCSKNHFGYLPEITYKFAYLREIDLGDRCLSKMIHIVLDMIDKKMYNYRFNPEQLYEQVAVGCFNQAMCLKDDGLDGLRRFNKLVTLGKQLSIRCDSLSSPHAAALAQVEGRWADAIIFLNEVESKLAAQYGKRSHQQIPIIYLQKGFCFAKLGDKKAAERCLKEAKKSSRGGVGVEYSVKRMKKMIKQIKRPRKSLIKTSVALGRCSNPLCSNVEKFQREFVRCSACKGPTYCSEKCQKIHWKTGHKTECKKAAKRCS